MRAMEQVGRGDALQHQHGRGLVVHVVRPHHDLLGWHRPHAHVGTWQRARVGHAVAGEEMRDAVTHVDDDTGRFHAEWRRRLDHPVEH
jgi:hypothetical protein